MGLKVVPVTTVDMGYRSGHYSFGFGNTPAEYNVKVHGPYNPALWYGKPHTRFRDVKIGELPAWFMRRSFHPLAIGRSMGRGYWRWLNTWVHPRKAGPAWLYHIVVGMATVYGISYLDFTRNHHIAKYH